MVMGILQSVMYELRQSCYTRTRTGKVIKVCKPEYIVKAIKRLTNAKYDGHILIIGPNGSGKSIAQMIMARTFANDMGLYHDFNSIMNNNQLKFIYAYHDRAYAANTIRESTNALLLFDEIKAQFDHHRSLTLEQNNLYNAVEISRSHLNVYIGCTREFEKIHLDYRNGKVMILIRLFDRVMMPNGMDTDYVYGHVYIGNPAMETEDKFMQFFIQGYSFNRMLATSEKLPTFIGTIVFKDYTKYGMSKADMDLYDIEKEKGIQQYANFHTAKKGKGNDNES